MKTVTWVLLATSLAIGWGCARSDWIERTLVTSDVTGVWEGLWEGSGTWASGGWVQLVLQQEGAKVTGVMRASGPNSRGWSTEVAIEGTVNGDTFTFREVTGPATRREYHVNGDVMTGGVQGWSRATLYRRP